MHKNYTKTNLISLLVIIVLIFFLVILFEDSENIVEFSDPGLEEAVRYAIEKENGAINIKDINTLQVLDASNRKIKNLDGVENLIELRDLNLEDNFIKSVSPIKNLTKLEKLNLRNNEIKSLKEIQFQDIIYLNIRNLSLRHNVERDEEGNDTRLSDISLLTQMVSLRKLDLRDNHIKDLSPISDLRRLTELDIRENKFESIEPLETLTRLKKLNIRDNKTKSLKPIRYLSYLTYLNIHSNTNLESLEPIQGLVNLETLIMRNVKINDISFLNKLTKIQDFNAIDTGIEKLDPTILEKLLSKNALQGEVRPIRMLHTLDPPEFSQESGFYKKAFTLDIKSKDNDKNIYYTLDGSEPNLNSNLYSEAIEVKEVENSGTIVRAKILGDDNKMSETVTKTYFTHKDIANRFNLPIFSIVTDPGNLFNKDIGIYTEKNMEKRGSDWERPVNVDYFGSNGELKLTQNAGIRIHGNWSRVLPQKSFRLYAKSEYDSKDTFDNVFFDNLKKRNSNEHIDSFENIILRNSGNDNDKTMFADGFMQELAKPINTFDTQAYQPTVIFINGKYFGIQNIRERLDEYYLENHYDIDKEDSVILENNAKLYHGKNKDAYHYINMIKYIEKNDMKDNNHLNYIETQMDFDSFIDYFSTEIYYGNVDWPQNNIQFWRKITGKNTGKEPYGHDGRWRWMLLDTDMGFYPSDRKWGYNEAPTDYKNNTIKAVMNKFDVHEGKRTWSNLLFRELMSNENFKNRFLVRFNDIANGYLNEYAANKIINEKMNTVEEEIPKHIDRWNAIPSVEDWHSSINNKYTFAKERPNHIRKFIIEEFDLDGTLEINVTNETERGYIRLNRMNITNKLPGNEGNDIWSGTYFKGIPIKVKAIAKEGYEFSHWENLNSEDKSIEINPQNDLKIKAIFKEKTIK